MQQKVRVMVHPHTMRCALVALVSLALLSVVGTIFSQGASSAVATLEGGPAQVRSGDIFALAIFIEVAADVRVSAAELTLTYPSDVLEYLPSNTPNLPGTELCPEIGLPNRFYDDAQPERNRISIARGSLAPDDQLPSGKFCFTPIHFRAKALLTSPATVQVAFDPSDRTEIVGPNDYNSTIVFDPARKSSAITITDSSATTVSPTGTPTVTQTSTPTRALTATPSATAPTIPGGSTSSPATPSATAPTIKTHYIPIAMLP